MASQLDEELSKSELEQKVAPDKPKRRASGRTPLSRVSYWFAVPAILLYLVFSFGPNAFSAFYAFTDWNGISPDFNWVGFRNFETIWDNPALNGALQHSLLLGLSYMVLVNVIGAAMAVGLNRQLKSRKFLRALFYAPAVVSSLAVAFVWQFIFQPDGALNSVLGSVGLSSLQSLWLVDNALWSVLAVMLWHTVGLSMILYLAGLQGIPDELYEAAALDGAGPWSQFRHVTLPLLAPATTIGLTVSMVYGFRVFDQILGLTQGGPGSDTETLATQVYNEAFVNGRLGVGAALALMLSAIMAILTLGLVLFFIRRGRA